jgi:hypothetical protein
LARYSRSNLSRLANVHPRKRWTPIGIIERIGLSMAELNSRQPRLQQPGHKPRTAEPIGRSKLDIGEWGSASGDERSVVRQS